VDVSPLRGSQKDAVGVAFTVGRRAQRYAFEAVEDRRVSWMT